MKRIIPTKTQFKNWRILSRIGYIAFLLSLFSLILMILFFVIQTSTSATKEGQAKAQSDRNAKHEEQLMSINRVKTLVENNATVKERLYVSEFSADEWVASDGLRNQLLILYVEHNVNNPIVSVQQKDENGNWQDIGCEIEIDKFNNVIISVIYGFDGRVVLK